MVHQAGTSSRSLLGLLVFAVLVGPPHGQHAQGLAADSVCAAPTGFSGQCYSVHGRLRVYATGPAIWVVGTKHYLKVEDVDQESGPCIAPENVRQFFSAAAGVALEAFGDFVVRARAPYHPGWLQRVCVASATHLLRRKIPQ